MEGENNLPDVVLLFIFTDTPLNCFYFLFHVLSTREMWNRKIWGKKYCLISCFVCLVCEGLRSEERRKTLDGVDLFCCRLLLLHALGVKENELRRVKTSVFLWYFSVYSEHKGKCLCHLLLFLIIVKSGLFSYSYHYYFFY